MKKLLQKEESTLDELFDCIKEIEAAGNIFILKVDGEREENHNTVMITFSNSDKDMIRYDESDIKVAIKKALFDYISMS